MRVYRIGRFGRPGRGARALAVVLLFTSAAGAADYYVDAAAPGGGDGSIGQPFKTIQQGLDAAQPGDNAIVRGGTYTLSAVLSFPRSGAAGALITLRAFAGETVLVQRSPAAAIPLIQTTRSYITIEDLIFDGNYGTANGLLRFDAGNFQTLRRCEVRRHGNHMVRLDSSDFLMEDCHVHHAIWPSSPSTDAHCLHSQTGFRHTFRRCDVHHATGDLWQGSRDGPWGDVVFEGCDLHVELADGDCNGIAAGTPITENHLDTKVVTVNPNVTVRYCLVRGTRKGRLGSMSAALNLKENVQGFAIHNNLIYDNAMAFRLRYPSTGYQVYNNFIYDNDLAVRLENENVAISDLAFSNNTFYSNTTLITNYDGTPVNLTWKNNIFANATSVMWRGIYTNNLFWQVPAGWPAVGNFSGDPRFVNPAAYDLHLQDISPAVNTGLTLAGLTDDIDGDLRPVGTAYDIGADEFRWPGDVDRDGDVDVFDVIDTVNAFGSTPGDPHWNPNADFDHDGQITVFDVIDAVTNFGKTL